MRLLSRLNRLLPERLASVSREALAFGIIGVVNLFLDIALFNLFHFSLGIGPLTSKTLSLVAATISSYLMNRYWAFRHRKRSSVRSELPAFAALNFAALLISLVCLGFARYVLGMTSPLALNVAGNIVGTGLGTVFRFVTYRRFVFRAPDHPHPEYLEPL